MAVAYRDRLNYTVVGSVPMLVALLLVACSTAPVVRSIEPDHVAAGGDLVIRGENFASPASVTLMAQDRAIAIDGVVRGSDTIEATLPADTPPGAWALTVTVDGSMADDVDVVVEPPREEKACDGSFTSNTLVSLAKQEIRIERYYPGDQDHVRIDIGDVQGIEYERTFDEGGLCSAIFLRLRDGRRVLFDDDRRVELDERGYKLAETIGRPYQVVKEQPVPPTP